MSEYEVRRSGHPQQQQEPAPLSLEALAEWLSDVARDNEINGWHFAARAHRQAAKIVTQIMRGEVV